MQLHLHRAEALLATTVIADMINASLPDHIAEALTPKHLRLIVFPTEKCNLRCSYCYEDFAVGRIMPEVVVGLKNLITSRASELNLLELAWFGGEPLLASKDILDICSHAKAVSTRNPQLQYISSMTTNGVLLNSVLAFQLYEVGVKSYQISLDGPRELHDRSRNTVRGSGTFDVIWKNLCALAQTDMSFEITIRLHYRIETWRELFPLIDDINRAFGEDQRFRVFFKSIVRLGGKNDESIKKISSAENKDILETLYRRLVNRSAKTAHWVKDDYVCYAAKANSLVIRADGAINKCTVALSDDRNVVGRVNMDGSLTIDRNKFMPWLRGIETQVPLDLACPYTSHMKKAHTALPN